MLASGGIHRIGASQRAAASRVRPRLQRCILMPLLFTYGTLPQEVVQMATFGRPLHGQPDELIGFEQLLLKIEDPLFVAKSGKLINS